MALKSKVLSVLFIVIYFFTIFTVINLSSSLVVHNKILLSDNLNYIITSLVTVVILLFILILNKTLRLKTNLYMIISYLVTLLIFYLYSSLNPLFIFLSLALSGVLCLYLFKNKISRVEHNIIYYCSFSILILLAFAGLFDFFVVVFYFAVLLKMVVSDSPKFEIQLFIYLIGLDIVYIVNQFI